MSEWEYTWYERLRSFMWHRTIYVVRERVRLWKQRRAILKRFKAFKKERGIQ